MTGTFWIIWLAIFSACEEPCLDLCQQYEAWINRCGISWETAFPDDEWETIEDCYDAYEDAGESKSSSCADEADIVAEDECY